MSGKTGLIRPPLAPLAPLAPLTPGCPLTSRTRLTPGSPPPGGEGCGGSEGSAGSDGPQASAGESVPHVVVDVDRSGAGIDRAARPGEIAATAMHSLSESFDQVRAAAEVALGRLTTLPVRLSRIEREPGVKINAAFGAVIAKTAGEGDFVLRLPWETGRQDGPPGE